jgi:hypothetical protein
MNGQPSSPASPGEGDLVLHLRGRQQRLVEERDLLASQITALQGRQGAIAVELSRIDALLELYEPAPPGSPIPPSPKPVGEKGGPTSTPTPKGPTPTEVPTTPPPVPPEGAWRAEAIRLLEEHGGPMHYKDLYHALANHGFPFGGRNPQAVLLTGVSREKETFVAVGKGCYWIVGREIPTDAAPPASPRTSTQSRRPRPIGRPVKASRK